MIAHDFVGLIFIPTSPPLFVSYQQTLQKTETTETDLCAIRPFPSCNHLLT